MLYKRKKISLIQSEVELGSVKEYINFLDFLWEKNSYRSSCLVFNFVYTSVFKKILKGMHLYQCFHAVYIFPARRCCVGGRDHMKCTVELLRYGDWQKFGREQIFNQKVKKSNAPGVFFKHKFEMWDVLVAFRSLLNRDRLKTFARSVTQRCVWKSFIFPLIFLNLAPLIFFKRVLYLAIYPYCIFI